MVAMPIDAVDHPQSIAVVGLAARVPGADNAVQYWANLREGVESVVRHTREEMLANGADPAQVDDPDYVPASAPLGSAECFDAAFFNYSSREAAVMDPQHRVFLECAYHALEDAGYDGERFGGLIGVYAGSTMNTYLLHNVMANMANVVAAVGDLQIMVGNDKEFMPTRASHRLNLRGPSIGVQTACSSSLVAVHMAARALLDGECDMALAGGASIRLPHGAGYLSTRGATSSPDGHCRAFDAAASGSVVGNGAGLVVLKRLADAIADGDQIRAVLRGSAVNNDGAGKASFTAPSVDGQSRAVSRALDRAGVSARDLHLVEAHGTGTPLGDPIEVAALTRAFRAHTADAEYCWLGSVKPNIGHLDAAAGAVGLIKTILALQHRRVPPLVNFTSPNPALKLSSSPFRIPTELVRLDPDGPLYAGVNSLAMGGTNAHVILESPPPPRTTTPPRHQRQPILLSAHTAQALDELSRSVGQWVRERPNGDLADLAHTLATGRRQLRHRCVVHARDLEDLGYGLVASGSRRRREGVVESRSRLAFLFPGQGAQRLRMGTVLAAGEPVFAARLDEQLDRFERLAGLDLRASLLAPDEPAHRAALARTEITQPALFAVELALAETLIEHGVQPYAMLGHSVGELVAATVAGILSPEDAVGLVAERGRLMADTPPGAMLYVVLAPEEVEARLSADGPVNIATVNGDRLVVVSGPVGAVDELERQWRAEKVMCGRLEVDRAFHSSLMEPVVEPFREAAARLSLHAPQRAIVSTVTGQYLTPEQAADPGYWAAQIRRPVRFADGVRTLLHDGVTTFLEVGPGRSLSRLVEAIDRPVRAWPVLRTADGSEPGDLLDLLTTHWLSGGEVDWAVRWRGERRTRLSLPLYPFARTRHWLEPHRTPRPVDRDGTVPGVAVPTQPGPPPVATGEATWTSMERYLARVWRRLLGCRELRQEDNFFDLDGHSLLAMQMITTLRRHGAEEIELTAVFEAPTLSGLAARLEAIGMTPPADEDDEPAGPPDTGAPAFPPAARPVAGPDPETTELLAEIETMSDDEVHARLLELEAEQ
jgi:acyl transferase domain-containing protein